MKVVARGAATIDRMLAATRSHIDGQRKRRKGVGSAIRRSIPVRTFVDWRDPPPGYFEIDMVEHCGGPKTDGRLRPHPHVDHRHPSGWTECVVMRTCNQMLVIEGFDKVAADLPFAMLGVDSDNDGARVSTTTAMAVALSRPVRGPTRRTTRPGLSRRTAPRCGGWSALGA